MAKAEQIGAIQRACPCYHYSDTRDLGLSKVEVVLLFFSAFTFLGKAQS
jgi:hypothetical protein